MCYPYNSQTLTISINMGQNISTGTNFRVYYKKPLSKTKGSWAATRVGEAITYNATNGEIDEPGVWIFQPYYENGGQVWGGEVEQYVGENLATA